MRLHAGFAEGRHPSGIEPVADQLDRLSDRADALEHLVKACWPAPERARVAMVIGQYAAFDLVGDPQQPHPEFDRKGRLPFAEELQHRLRQSLPAAIRFGLE